MTAHPPGTNYRSWSQRTGPYGGPESAWRFAGAGGPGAVLLPDWAAKRVVCGCGVDHSKRGGEADRLGGLARSVRRDERRNVMTPAGRPGGATKPAGKATVTGAKVTL